MAALWNTKSNIYSRRQYIPKQYPLSPLRERWEPSQRRIISGIPISEILRSKVPWSTLSKALVKLVWIISVRALARKPLKTWVVNSRRLVTVDLLFKKPCWKGDIKDFILKKIIRHQFLHQLGNCTEFGNTPIIGNIE